MDLLRIDGPGWRVRREHTGEHLEIAHATRYEFSQPVFLEPHVLRFQPRADGAQLPLEFCLDVDPAPVGQSSWLDSAGNVATSVWFEGLHESLTISARSLVEMRRDNPFDYLPDCSRTLLPVFYGDEAEALRPYLRRETPGDGADEVAVFAARMRAAAGGELVALLASINHTMYERMDVIRHDGASTLAPAQTWRRRGGASRDLAWLFVDVCRAAGVAARVVSGYAEAVSSSEEQHLHAWAEVYVPGGGWRGYDPVRGLAAAAQHITIAAAATPEGAAPVVGTFRGTGATSRIETQIKIDRLAPALAP